MVVTRAREIKAEVVVTASTGNAGAALAGMSAAVGQKAVIFAPKSAPQAKVAQLLVFGAKVILVDGTYDEAFDLTIKAADEFGWYCRNTGYNPFTLEGKKTAAFEIWEWWLGAHRDWHKTDSPLDNHPPLTIFVSVGDGNIISGIHKGFKDLLALGWIPNMPRIIGVQAEGSAAIANAFRANTETITPVSATTLADSISVDLPRDGVRAVRAAKETGGTYITVPDDEIIKAIAELGKMGVFCRAGRGDGLCRAGQGGRLGRGWQRRPGAGDEYRQRAQGRPRGDAGGSARSHYRTDFGSCQKGFMKDTPWSISARYVAGIIVLVAIVALLIYARQAVKMLVIAGFVSYLVSPAVAVLTQNTKLSRTAAVNIVYFSALIVMVGVPATLTPIFFDEIKIVASDLLDLSAR